MPINLAKFALILSSIIFLISKTKIPRQALNLILNSGLIVLSTIIIFSIFIFFHGTRDFSLIYNFLIMFLEAYLGSLLLVMIFYRNYNEKKLFGDLVNVGIIQSLIILSMLLSPLFREYIFDLTGLRGVDVFDRYGGFRGLGLASSIAFDLSTSLCMSQLFLIYRFITSKKVSILEFSFQWLIIFAAITISGRTGIIFSVLSIFIFACSRQDFFKIIKLFSPLFFFGVLLGPVFLIEVSRVLGSTFTNIAGYLQELTLAGRNIRSVEVLLQSIHMPDINTLLYGLGRYTFEIGDQKYTDMGYLRHLNYIGIFGLALIISFYLYNFLFFHKRVKLVSRHQKYLLFCVFSFPFLWHLKGDILIGSGLNIKILFLAFFFFFLKNAYRVPDCR